MGEGQRAFRGVWICAAVWKHPGLSWIEKALLAKIDSLVDGESACCASNECFAEHIGVSVSRVNTMLSRLQTAGFVLRLKYDGRITHRVVNPPEAAKHTSRYSMPLFLHPRPEVPLTPDRTAGAYLEERLREIGIY